MRRRAANAAGAPGTLALVVWLWLVLGPLGQRAHAGNHDQLVHKVKQGDSIQLLAAEYYGDRRHAIFIMVANAIQHDRPLQPGEKLKIPMNREVTVAPGDTLSNLAERYLGDARRAGFLAQYNKLEPSASLAAGQAVQIPLTVSHKAAGEERLADISAAFFATPKNAKLIAEYNFLDKQSLAPGETVVIPITHVQVRRSRLPPPDKESQERVAKREAMQAQALQSLERARAAWREGDYAAVKRDLTRIDTDYLDTALAVDVAVLLGSTYVAFGDTDSALAAFRKALERAPKHAMDAYQVSPKIRDVWTRAGGAVETPQGP